MSDGDFDIAASEWRDLPKDVSQFVPEDVGHFSFSQSRQFSFLHKRTSMLFIGPKNAPTAQTHYTFADAARPGFGLNSVSSIIFLIVSKFEGVPFSDCFKTLQYWVLDRGAKPDTTLVTCGIGVHFQKPTMMRAKIESGVKEEMATQVRRLLNSIVGSIKQGGAAAGQSAHMNSNSLPSLPRGTVSTGFSTSHSGADTLSDLVSTKHTYLFDSYRWIQILLSVAFVCGAVALLAR